MTIGVNSVLFKNLGLDSFSSFSNKSDDLKNLAALAGSIAAGPALVQVLEPVVEAVLKNPQQAAEIARKASQLGAALVRGTAEPEDTGVSRTKESTTIKKEAKDGNTVTRTTTTTTTTTETIDLAKQAEYNKRVAGQIEKLGAGLPEGKIQFGDETITFEQIQDLVVSVLALLESGKAGKEIDITELSGKSTPSDGSQEKGNTEVK